MTRTLISAALLFGLAGCSTSMYDRVNGTYGDKESLVRQLLDAQRADIKPNTATSVVPTVYLGSKSVPFKTDLVLPEIFRRPKEFQYGNLKMTLAQAVEKISKDSGIPIRIAQDVYSINGKAIAATTEQPVGEAAAAQGGSTVKAPVPSNFLTLQPGATGQSGQQKVTLNLIELNTTATPAAVLDQICILNGLNWEYRDGTAIIQRLVSRNFTLKVSPGQSDFDFQVGKNGSAQASSTTTGTGTISTGFTTNSTLKRKGTMSPMESVEKQVKAVLTELGNVVTSPASGSITVIDTIDGIDRAAKIIDRENDILTRNATFRIELISFKQNNNEQYGLDLNVLFSNLSKLGGSISAPASLVSSTGASVGLNVLSGTGTTGRFDGSSAFLKLLNEVGTATTLNSIDVEARNRSMTPASILNQQVYLARTTPASASSVNGTVIGTPGLEPGTITTGLDMKLQPNILDSNQISLLMSVGMVDLVRITTLTSGQGANQQSIEAPETSGYEFQFDVNLEPGKTAILSGYERVISDYTRRTLGRDVPMMFGGSFNGQANKEKIFILVTPIIKSTTF